MQPKADFRLAIKERLKRMTQRDREVESQVLCRNLRQVLGPDPRILAAYMPYIDEPDIAPLLRELMDAGWTIAMPAAEGNHLVFRHITNLSQNRRHPVTGIMEAPPECPPVNEASIADAIVPGRAFTAQGGRMGRGNGGYDYWIAAQRKRQPKTRYIGVCFDCQMVQDVPMDMHDQPVDIVVTSRGVSQAKKV